MPRPTLPDLVSGLLRDDAARPLVTFYDDATGERVELSVATFANWVAKTAALCQEELDVEPGGLVRTDLPTHWLGAVWLVAAWTAGCCVTDSPDAGNADLVVCGPTGLDRYAQCAGRVPVVALSLQPLAGRFSEPLPPGVIDYGAVVLAQPDDFVPLDPPTPDAAAWRTGDRALTQQQLLDRAAESAVRAGDRVLTDLNPCSEPGALLLTSLMVRSASAVLVANPDDAGWDRRYAQERATGVRRLDRDG